MVTYECFCCEDTEEYDKILKQAPNCECGGEMFLQLRDHYEEQDTKCLKCKNQNSELCSVCQWKNSKRI